jgi:hypothetical protein
VWKAAPLLCVVLLSMGCSSEPSWYAIPEQRKPLAPQGAPPAKSFLEMNDEEAPDYFLRDISDSLEGGRYRWTQQKPALRLSAPPGPLRLMAHFGISEVTFKQTGPVTISVLINGHILETATYGEPGDKHIEKPVQAGWVKPGAENQVSLEIDKVWVSPVDGARLGIVLRSIGFIQ